MAKKKFWGATIGAIDPLLKKLAQDLAKKVPAGSPLRSEIFGVVEGITKGFIESLTGKLPPAAAMAVEKATDFSDFFSGALGSAPEKEKKAATEDWMNKFFIDAGFRLKRAKDPRDEFKRIKVEFELRCELIKLIETTQTKPPAPALAISWQEMFAKWKKQFREFSQGFKEFAAEIDKDLCVKENYKKTDAAIAGGLKTFRDWLTKGGIR